MQPLMNKIAATLREYEESGQAEAREIAELIQGNMNRDDHPRDNLLHAIAMCDAFAKCATEVKGDLELLDEKRTTSALTPAELVAAKARIFDEIADLLFPPGEPDHEWDGGTIEEVGDWVKAVYPNCNDCDRTINPELRP